MNCASVPGGVVFGCSFACILSLLGTILYFLIRLVWKRFEGLQMLECRGIAAPLLVRHTAELRQCNFTICSGTYNLLSIRRFENKSSRRDID